MAAVEEITIALPAEVAAAVREAVRAGGYESSGEVVRDALQEWHQNHVLTQRDNASELNRLWQEARGDESAGLHPDEVFDALERKYQSSAENIRTQQ